VKNLLKFISIGLVLTLALFSQATFLTSPTVEAADVSENDIDFMTQTAAATVLKHYKASSSNETVAIYVRDADLNKTITGTTTWAHCPGRIAALTMTGAADALRTEGTYLLDHGDYTTFKLADSTVVTARTGPRLTAAVSSNGTVTVAASNVGFLDPGCDFIANDTITVADAALGGGGGAAYVMTVATLDVQLVAATGLDFDGTTVFSLDDTVRVVGETKVTVNAGNLPDFYAQHKQEDSDGNAGRADTVAEKAATPHQYLGAETSLVLNSLSVKQGNVTLGTRAVNELAGTFKLATADTVDVPGSATNDLTASYTFNGQQTYSALAAGAKRVHITSTSDATGEWIAIAEVADEGSDDAIVTYDAGVTTFIDNRTKMGHIDSSIFRGTVSINTDASAGAADNGAVWVQDGDTLTANYYQAKNTSTSATGALISSTTATIDSTAPTISGVSPADGTLTKDTTPSLTFTIEDGGSGFDSSVSNFGDHVEVSVNGCDIPDSALGVTAHSTGSITIMYNAAVDWTGSAAKTVGGAATVVNCQSTETANATHVRASGGFNVTSDGSAVALTSSTVHGTLFSWYVKATDDAGNWKALGDNVHNLTATTTSELDLRIDTKAPAATAVTGAKAWSESEKKDVSDNSSVKITFDESLDANSVVAADFTVSGVGVTSSTIQTVTMGGTGASTDSLVYLDLAADLGPNAKPKVKLVGQVTDRAGNILKPATTETTGKTLGTSTDSVKPTLSDGALSETLIAKAGKTTFTYGSNENLTKTSGTFNASRGTYGSVSGGGKTSGTSGVVAMDQTDAGKVSITLSNPTSGKGTVKHSTAHGPVPMTKTGIYGITAVGRDAADNIGVGGLTKVVEDISAYFAATAPSGWSNTVGELETVGAEGANTVRKFKLKNWPLADHDGDGSLEDSITALTVSGTSPAQFGYVDGAAPDGLTRGGFRYDGALATATIVNGTAQGDDVAGTYDITATAAMSNGDGTGADIKCVIVQSAARACTVDTVAGTGYKVGEVVTVNSTQMGDANANVANVTFTILTIGGKTGGAVAADEISAWVSAVDWSENETISLTVTDDADVLIAAGATVKVTYYYVNSAQVVELDLDAPLVTILPANLASTTDKSPSISFAWDDDEYAGDTNTTVTMTKAELLDPDSATLDILASITTTDNKTFYYRPEGDLGNGEYKITVSAKDIAGNEKKDQTSKFTVKDRTKTTVAMVPGWNLISIPAALTDGAINTVITNTQVETVLTYDPATPGGWLTAVRDGDTLVGTLSTIDESHAYWIFQKNGDDIKVDLPGYKGGASATPPAISIVAGWNLIPVVTLTIGESTVATGVDKDGYLWGIDWVKAKGWDAANEKWTDVVPDTSATPDITNGTELKVGSGYWLYANAAGVIVP